MEVTGQPEFKDLIPQIIWRGSDYPTLQCMTKEWMPGHYFQNIDPNNMSRQDVANGLLEYLDRMTPRWRAVANSVAAKLEAEREGELPWIDAMFLKKKSESQPII